MLSRIAARSAAAKAAPAGAVAAAPAAPAQLPRFAVASFPIRLAPGVLDVPLRRRRAVAFIGAFPTRGLPLYHNGDAVIHWAGAIAPRVYALLAGGSAAATPASLTAAARAHPFIVLGRDPPSRVRELHNPSAGVIIRGFSEDMSTDLTSVRVVVVPHQYSAGASRRWGERGGPPVYRAIVPPRRHPREGLRGGGAQHSRRHLARG